MVDQPPQIPAASRRRRTTVLLLAGSSLMALVLSACDGPSVGHPQAERITIPATSAPPGVLTPSAPALSLSSTLQMPACSPSGLKLALTKDTDTLGQRNYTLSVTNTGQIDCFLDGYPNVHALGRDGSSQGVAADMVGLTAPGPIVLRPSLSAIADLHVADGQTSGVRCERRGLSALGVDLGQSLVGKVSVQGNPTVCVHGSAGLFGVTTWAAGPTLDEEDDNDG
jgi:hypothetical protein